MTNLQYKLSSGKWIDCCERSAEFLARCVAFAGGNEAAVIAALAAGTPVQNSSDWYGQCRDADIAKAAAASFEAGAAARTAAAVARRAADGYFNHQ